MNKKLTVATLCVALATVCLFSCKKKHTTTDNTTTTITPAQGTTVISGEINSDAHWTSDMHILLSGYVYVTAGHTLTIDAGTIIKGDKASKGSLIIEKGAKINAVGTSTNPIIFTSNQPAGQRTYGDWGGVIICGNAPNNWIAAPKTDGTSGNLTLGIGQVEGGPRSLYGGSDPADNSGILTYARVEFGGVAFSPNNEINGLTLCSVGSGTTIDHIQVSYSGDDSYEWFGGNVNCKYLVAHRGWDDDFDTDNGYSGSVQYGMIYRDKYAADQSGSHTFESDSRNENATATPITKAVFSNVTAVGPLVNPGSFDYNSNFVCGQIVRRSSSLSVFNSLIIGYPLGVIVDEDPNYGSTIANINSGSLKFMNNAVIQTPNSTAVIVSRLNDPHSAPNSIATTSDSTTVPFTATGPRTWFNTNTNYYGPTEGLTSRLLLTFSNTQPSFIPASTSFTVYNTKALPPYMAGSSISLATAGKYPYDETKAINTDTTSRFAHYNAPNWLPNTNDATLTGSGAITENHIGAFKSTNNWVAGWTNFDPVNANYGSQY